MKILHTSDWHLGRSLYGKKRYAEFESFLSWLITTIKQEQTDILLIAGDVFDTTTPSNRAQELYYQFLCQVAITTSCQHVVIIAGNHDSPTLLNAPKQLLRELQIHVVGSISDNLADEVLLLKDKADNELAFICAVPYLRDRDIREVEDGESIEDKYKKIISGIRKHYTEVCDIAKHQRQQLAKDIPIIGMGHLFTAGGKTESDDGVRELYVGALARVAYSDFPQELDYLALGHLHVPQIVSGQEHIRYSGSPIAMGFGEAAQQKIVLSVKFGANTPQFNAIAVPKFQNLARIKGDLNSLETQIKQMLHDELSIWLEVSYTGQELVVNLNERLHNLVYGSGVLLLRIFDRPMIARLTASSATYTESIQDLTPEQVFQRCLDSTDKPGQQQTELLDSFHQILNEFYEQDGKADIL